MWSLNKTLPWILISLISLSGCGFQPLYGTQKAARTLVGVQIDEPEGETRSQNARLKIELEDRLNPQGRVPANPAFRLVTSLKANASPIGVARDGTVSRYNVFLESNYVLYRNSDSAAIAKGVVRHVSSYNNTESAYFSTYVSSQDAIRRGLTELAALYEQRLSSYLLSDAKPLSPADSKLPPLNQETYPLKHENYPQNR